MTKTGKAQNTDGLADMIAGLKALRTGAEAKSMATKGCYAITGSLAFIKEYVEATGDPQVKELLAGIKSEIEELV